MGLHFGELAVIRGIIYYRLSPHELRPLAGLFTRGIPNVLPRTVATVWTWLPPFVLGYAWYRYVEWSFHESKRKNPADYVNEVNPNPAPPLPPEEEKVQKCTPKEKKSKSESGAKAKDDTC